MFENWRQLEFSQILNRGAYRVESSSNRTIEIDRIVDARLVQYLEAAERDGAAECNYGVLQWIAAYVFKRTVTGVRLQVRINPTANNTYTFQAQSSGANLSGVNFRGADQRIAHTRKPGLCRA